MASRPATLPAAIVPVIVGTAIGARESTLHPGPFLAALLAAILIQIGTNLANDYFDFRKGADTVDRLGPVRVTQAGLASPSAVLVATLLTFAAAALLGVYLIFVGGWPIVAIGVASILSGLAYTGGPYPLGYHGLGDVFVFIFFGVVAVTGSAYLQSGNLSSLAVIASIPVGLLVTAILVVNNLRDVDTDRIAGKRTLAVRIGRQATRWQYVLFLALAYLTPVFLFAIGAVGGWFALPWVTIPLAIKVAQTVWTESGPVLNKALKQTGQLHLLFGILFTLSLSLP